MKIPDEAIEAAAKALWEVDISPSDRKYEDCREATRRQIRREVLAALTAAAPHIAAQAIRDMNPDRIRAAIRMLYPDEMTPTARNVLERILDDEELEASVGAGASSVTGEK